MIHIFLVHANVLHIDYFSYCNTVYHKYLLLPRMIRCRTVRMSSLFAQQELVMSYALRSSVSLLRIDNSMHFQPHTPHH